MIALRNMWDWLGDYCQEDVSNSLWSNLNCENEDEHSYMIDDETTPVKACGDLPYQVTDNEIMNKGQEQCRETYSQAKRRRMLQFDTKILDVLFHCNEDISSTFLKSKQREDSVEEAISDMSQWVSGFADDTSASGSGYDGLESSDDWLADCFIDTEMHFSPDDIGHRWSREICSSFPLISKEAKPLKHMLCHLRLSKFSAMRTLQLLFLLPQKAQMLDRPLIWIEAQIEKHSRSRMEIMVKARSQFKEHRTATNVEIELPVPADAINPNIRTSIGSVAYAPENDALLWKIKSFPGGKAISVYLMSSVPLPKRVVTKIKGAIIKLYWSSMISESTCSNGDFTQTQDFEDKLNERVEKMRNEVTTKIQST